jgi:subtilisin
MKMPKTPESATPQENPTPKGDGGASQPKPEEVSAASVAPGEKPQATQTARGKHTVSKRKDQYLIAPRKLSGMLPMGFQPLQFSLVEQTLRSSPDIEVVDTVGPKGIVGALSDGMSDATTVLVARMTEQKAVMLQQQGQGRLVVERDQSLNLLDPAFQPRLVMGAIPTSGPVLSAVFTILASDNTPLKDAEVYLFGSLLPANGLTDTRGQVTLTLFGETLESIRGLYVKPKANYWSFYQERPDISTSEENMVVVRPLAEWPSLANFPKQQVFGWGQRAMRLDQLPGNFRGQGIKIAVIDSGAANSHQDLRNVKAGFDIINKKVNPETWNVDTIAHGSHCVGVIAGTDDGAGVRGFAPDATIHACKLFPGGQVSQLIDALEYCIEKQIDVVNLSLGGAEPSEALEQQILRAKRAGIACIVAAGNSGGPVQYPASSPNVLAVSAIGRINEFPHDSYHMQTVTHMIDPNGFYAAKFSCFGPEIAVCAPGVAIASSVPPNDYAAWDGTSMAAPHVTGLAALMLAHHPDFQAGFKARNAERVERLFQLIKLSARRVMLGDASRTGFGMPDVLVAVGLQPQAGANVAAMAAALSAASMSDLMGRTGQNIPFAPAGVTPFAASYADQAQFAPRAWDGNPWGQASQAMGGTLMPMAGGMEQAYPGYMSPYFTQYPQGFGGVAPGGGFGMRPQSFGHSIW